MNLRIPLILIAICVAGILINHFVLDWKAISIVQIEEHFDQLISDQKNDLVNWAEDSSSDPGFRKRLYCADTLVKWSDSDGWIDHTLQLGTRVIENKNGVFLVQTLDYGAGCMAVSIFPIFTRFSITNSYLKPRRNLSLPENLFAVSNRTGPLQYDTIFFYELDDSPSGVADASFVLIALIAILVVFWRCLPSKFLLSISLAVIIRSFMLYFDVLESLIRFPVFDPLFFTWSFWNPTLGDLFVNCVLVFLVTLSWSRKFRVNAAWLSGVNLYMTAALSQLLSVMIFWVLWRILTNSQILLDVGQSIEFGYMRVFSFLCIILLIGSAFLVSFRLVGSIRRSRPDKWFYGFLLVLPLPFVAISLTSVLVALIFVLVTIGTSRLQWGSRLKEFKYENLQFALIISVISSGILSYSVYKYYEKSELDSKKKFANYLLIKKDVLGEYYLNQIMVEKRSSSGKDSEQMVKEQLLNPYFDKYDVVVVEPSDSILYGKLKSLMTEDHVSDYRGIYLIDDGTTFNYLCDLDDSVVSLELKKRVPTSVFPALLTDNKYYVPSDDYDYAVFKNGDILFQRSKFGQGEWPEVRDFEDVNIFDEGIEKKGRHYYGVRTVDDRVILIISKKYGFGMQLTNFSFFFLLSLFFLGSIVLLSSLNLKEARLNFTGKIQLYLGLAFIIPLFTAGFALLNSLNTSYREEINRSYLKQSLYISELLSDDIESSVSEITGQTLAKARDFIQADLSLYDIHGKLVATSQREIFDLGLQSDLVNPIVFSELIQKENLSTISDESIGDLEYKVSYATLNNQDNQIVGFIAMPFFDSKNHLKRQQLEVFGSLVSIFGLIFVIAILFGSMILNNLMKPLRMVADKISKITLQEENKPILYESSDEIGSLVRDYNSMLVKLEQSKSALVRSQKEVAWKEIAKQVAHEIKNPLTPMQLKIQQLLRKYEEGSKDYETLSSLLIQVDTLSQIASSFSAFAEMPAPDNTDLDFSKLLRQVVGLYHSDDVKITTDISDSIFIHADKDIFQRIINNIVLNSIQAVEQGNSEIHVKLATKADKCELIVSDNGKGIDDALKDKIFLNYFSTKSSGSGIGLALAKKGIENAGGTIWFESKKNEGTTFFITMPLAAS
ncbi:MAG: HAMP domain-containing sensor histidine kinase [Cyclobacteriaceae bacterium]